MVEVEPPHSPAGATASAAEALVGDEVAATLSKVSGKQVVFKSLTPDDFASAMSLLVTGSAEA
jgi:uncharacterized protein YbjT (DUF2867 family)